MTGDGQALVDELATQLQGRVLSGEIPTGTWLRQETLAAGAIVGARLGAGLLARIGERSLKVVFGCFLVAVAVAMGVHG